MNRLERKALTVRAAARRWLGVAKRDPKLALPVAVLLVGALLAGGLIQARPSVATHRPPRPTPLVRVVRAQPESIHLTIRAQGSVAPRTESDLIAEVSGRITWVSPSLAAGEFVQAGDPLLRIDRRDYEVAVARAQAALTRAESQLALAERASSRRRNLAERGVASPAALDDAENSTRVAEANQLESLALLTQARNDLSRTEITAPFAGRVRAMHVGVGQFVNRGSPLARIYAVDYAEIRLPISDGEAALVDLPIGYRGDGSADDEPEVVLSAEFGGREHRWQGRIVRTEGELDPRTRMIHAIARVEDPYGRGDRPDRPPLAVGLFVEAEISGRRVDGVYALPRGALRGNDRGGGGRRRRPRPPAAGGAAATPPRSAADPFRTRAGRQGGDVAAGPHRRRHARRGAGGDGSRCVAVRAAIAWFARNHVAANLVMFLLLIAGAVALPVIKQEIFPGISLDVISISVDYPGASPAEVEAAICVRIEEELQGLQGIKRIRSTASEGHGNVVVELLAGEDVRRRMDEIRNRVDRIESFPEDARSPQVTQADIRIQVLDVAVAGPVARAGAQAARANGCATI